VSKRISTTYPGVFYRERERKGKKDKYFVIRYRVHGKQREEGLGWGSEGWNAKKASLAVSELRQNYSIGDGPNTLRDKRKATKEREEAEQARLVQEAEAKKIFTDVFESAYFPLALADKKKLSTNRERSLFSNWIRPEIGGLPLARIQPWHLEKIKKSMADAGLSPRTAEYALATIRQVFNYAKRNGLFKGDNPVSSVKIPRSDNKRLRFLTLTEARELLTALRGRNKTLYDMVLLSLHSGLRAGEIRALRWADVNLERKTLTLKDTKSGRTRMSFLTADGLSMLKERDQKSPEDFVFQGRGGGMLAEISRIFNEVVDNLGFNEGITDRRQKVVFHTLRHTYASWLVEHGVDLYTVKELLGHCTIGVTERYAHIANGTLLNAVRTLESAIMGATNKVVKINN
jgi:integrase